MTEAMEQVEKTVCFRKAAWIIAWDAAQGSHVYRRDGDLAFRGDEIVHVGGRFEGHADVEIDARALMLVPGLINSHFHSTATMSRKGINQDACNYLLPAFYQNVNILQPDMAAKPAVTAFGVGRLLQGGTTTLMDWIAPYDGWIDVLAETGVRAYVAPFFTSAYWSVHDHGELRYEWLEDGGRALYEQAVATMDAAEAHPSGRLHAMVAPSELEACSEELLRESRALARQRPDGVSHPRQTRLIQAGDQGGEYFLLGGGQPGHRSS